MRLFVLLVYIFGLSAAFQEERTSEIDIYPYVLNSLRELKIRQLAEKIGIKYALNNDVQYASSVCYEDLGCFDVDGTFGFLKQLPDTPENIGTQFLLYTNKNPDEPQIIDYKKPNTVLKSNLDPKLPLKFITHGFGGRNTLSWVQDLKRAFLKMEKVNIIVVDWSKGAATPHYINSVVNSELVGAQIAAMFYFIKDNLGIQEKDLHVVGFSLGGQVMGFVGKRMRKLRGTKPGRITGLDPAAPLYEGYGEEVHLFRDDAEYMDVIHTNADLLIYGGVGMGKPVGHADYYPNGGIRQPGCPSTIKGAFIDIFTKGINVRKCNHERAVHLFIESILNPTSCQFTSYECENYTLYQEGKCFGCVKDNSCGTLGYHSKGTKGLHYLVTSDSSPFCADSVSLSIEFSNDNKKSYGGIVVFMLGKDGYKENATISKPDEKLMPGDLRMLTVAVGTQLKPLKEVQVLYNRYNGWLSKGTETFTLSKVQLTDVTGKILFSTCGEILLKDDALEHLQQSSC